MKKLFFFLVIATSLAAQASEVGWGERGNGNEGTPPRCKLPADNIKPPIPRPIPEPRTRGFEADPNCYRNPINGDGDSR
jgi:hypothetical protein